MPAKEKRTLTARTLIFQLAAFGGYTLSLIILAGQAFSWNENRRLFYLGGRRLSLPVSIATFVATWMSAASLLGYTVWIYRDGYPAFTGSVNGWLLGLLFLPFSVAKLRKTRALSLPEWLGNEFGDSRLRTLSALALLLAYSFYIVIQFRVFGTIVSQMLEIPPFLSSTLIYLFVIYTTFGGLPSVVKSDALNLVIIVLGVTAAAFVILHRAGSPIILHSVLAKDYPEMLHSLDNRGFLFTFSMMLGWGLGVAANPQYAVRIMSARNARTAWSMIWISALIVGWIYVCTTFIGLGGKVLFPALPSLAMETSFCRLLASILPSQVYTLLLLAVLAAAVSTANSQLLLATCSFCYDLFPSWSANREKDFLSEDHFLFINRLGIAGLATFSLLLSQLPLPGILDLGQYSWAVVAICFLLPLYMPGRKKKEHLFTAITVALLLHTVLVYGFHVRSEQALLPSLGIEGALWWFSSRRTAT